MKFKRFFAFGCSFTKYHWPTWPTIVEYDLAIPSQNWGMCGQGNVGMFHRMIEADIKNKFNEDDLIVTAWSTWHREDRYLGSWTLSGNIFNDPDLYDGKFRRKYWNLENDIVKNAGVIIAANKAFNINYQCNIVELEKNIYKKSPMYKFYSPYLPHETFPWDHCNQESFAAFNGYLDCDNHPDIKGHLDFVKDQLYPALGLTMKQETIDYFTDLQQKVTDKLKHVTITWDNHTQFFESFGWHLDYIGH